MILSAYTPNSPVRNIVAKVEQYISSTATVYGEEVTISKDSLVYEISAESKNLYSYSWEDDTKTKTINGITFTGNEDGTITINGTATADIQFNFDGLFQAVNSEGEYTFSILPEEQTDISLTVGLKDAYDETIVEEYIDSREVFFSTTPDFTYYAFIEIPSGTTINNIIIYPQLERGTYATAYTPRISDFTTITVYEALDGVIETEYPVSEEGEVNNEIFNTGEYDWTYTATPGAVIRIRYKENQLINVFRYDDELVSIDIERVGEESKFFGFGVCQKANIKLRNADNLISNPTTDEYFKVYFGFTGYDYGYEPPEYFEEFYDLYPKFYVSEVHKDEITKQLSITAYDTLYKASSILMSEVLLELEFPCNVYNFLLGCCKYLEIPSLSTELVANKESLYNIEYGSINFEGTETIREALNKVAEITQTVYYMRFGEALRFRQLGNEDDYTIDKSNYFSLESGDNRRLTAICHTTELGNNLISSGGEIGTTQYVRDNPFWEVREDLAPLLDYAIDLIGGLTINQFECKWRGNYKLEIGDRIGLVTKDDEIVYSYVLNDTISYDGSFSEKTQWKYEDNADGEDQIHSNPTSLGEVINQTFAKVDKTNKEIILVASEVSENGEAISSLKLDTESITGTVSSLKEATEETLGGLTEDVSALEENVSTFKQTSEEALLEFKTEITTNGVDKVTTGTGFTFNDEGLTVSKTDSEIKTTITEDGMSIYKEEEAVLIVNNEGVSAEDLHATTYLIIGTNSRFEDYGTDRTGCFWIGGSE